MDQLFASFASVSAFQLFRYRPASAATGLLDRLAQRLRDSVQYELFKRAFDLAGAVILLLGAAPVMLFVAVLLAPTGSVLFCQRRLTKGGEIFNLYKFRTMRPDAEAATGPTFARKGDPRVTRLGAFLRRTRIDELPQLFNVLKGDMSLIGPRPERPELATQLSEALPRFPERLQVRAGLTGLAQVHAGYAASTREFRRKLAYDLIYIKHRCLFLDLRIAVATIAVVLTGRGAQ